MSSDRLRAQSDFTRLYRRGRVVRSSTLLVRTAPNHKPVTRLAVVVSKKVAKSAVRRNRLRRQIQEAWRQEEQTTPGLDAIITVTADREHTPAEIHSALGRAGLLKT